jgi:hypothetical protein
MFARKCQAGDVIILQVKERSSKGFVDEQKKGTKAVRARSQLSAEPVLLNLLSSTRREIT